MKYMNEYKNKVEQFGKREPVGYYPYHITAKSEEAELSFAREKREQMEGSAWEGRAKRFYDMREIQDTVKKFFIKGDKEDLRLNGQAEMTFVPEGNSWKTGIKYNIEGNIENRYTLRRDIDFTVEIGEFVLYPKKTPQSFADLPYLTRS